MTPEEQSHISSIQDFGSGGMKWISVEDGWVFYSADFSMQASGRSSNGNVTLRRCVEDVVKWHKMPDELKDDDNGPELFVNGAGRTIEEAIDNANLLAVKAKPIPPTDKE